MLAVMQVLCANFKDECDYLGTVPTVDIYSHLIKHIYVEFLKSMWKNFYFKVHFGWAGLNEVDACMDPKEI